MAFLKKKAYNQACKNENILYSLFTDTKDVEIITIDDDGDCLESTITKLDDYKTSSSPVCTTETCFDTNNLHSPNCPIETKKPTNINMYTRYSVNSFSNLPTYYLVWYNVVISTGYRNYQQVCCASVKIDVSTIIGSSGFMCHLQKNICCETSYTTNIETVENIEDSIYLDSITRKTSKTENTVEETFLSSTFVDFYNVLLSVFEEIYPNCITFGLNNIIVKNIEINTNKIFSIFLEKIKDLYNFYYKPVVDDTILTEDIKKIESWLSSPITEKLCCLESDDGSLDFLGLLE